MTCLKCGRTVPTNIFLCPECLAMPKKSAPPEPEPLQEELQEEKIQKLSHRKRRLQRWLAVFLVLSLAATTLLAATVYDLHRQYNRVSAQTSKINSLETAMEELKSELEQTNALSDTMRKTITENQKILNAYRAYTGLSPDKMTTVPLHKP